MASGSAWSGAMPRVGQKAERSQLVRREDITGSVLVLEVREDEPITKLATSVRRQDGVVVLEGTAACYTMDMTPRPGEQG